MWQPTTQLTTTVSLAIARRAAGPDTADQTMPLPEFVSRLTTGALLLERAADFARGLRQLEAVLREGRPLILFPEGRRSPDGRLVEFKPGAAMLAMRTGTPIVPIRLVGLHEAM